MYNLETMSPEEINQVIHTRVLMHPQFEACYGPITLNVVVGRASTGLWTCQRCSAKGEYPLTAFAPVLHHPLQAPDYHGKLGLALQVIEYVRDHWNAEQKRLFDFFLFGIDYAEIARLAGMDHPFIVDAMAQALNPKLICYACIHALNQMDQRDVDVLRDTDDEPDPDEAYELMKDNREDAS